MFDVTVIGPAVIDILASPVDLDAIAAGSRDLDRIRMSFGGDALNEAVALSRLGRKVRLISKVGDDVAGRRILSYMEENGIPTDDVRVQEGLDTAINIALIEKDGNRKFLMNPHSSLRRLSPEIPDESPQQSAPPVFGGCAAPCGRDVGNRLLCQHVYIAPLHGSKDGRTVLSD